MVIQINHLHKYIIHFVPCIIMAAPNQDIICPGSVTEKVNLVQS